MAARPAGERILALTEYEFGASPLVNGLAAMTLAVLTGLYIWLW